MSDQTANDGDGDGKLAFELASPEALLVSTRADMVVVPGAEGDFGVLPGHAPFISEVRPGVIDVYQGDVIDERIFVAGGFAEVNTKGVPPSYALVRRLTPLASPLSICRLTKAGLPVERA